MQILEVEDSTQEQVRIFPRKMGRRFQEYQSGPGMGTCRQAGAAEAPRDEVAGREFGMELVMSAQEHKPDNHSQPS